MITGNFSCCNCVEGTRGGLCANCWLWYCDYGVLLLVLRILFLDASEVYEVCVMNVGFNDSSYICDTES